MKKIIALTFVALLSVGLVSTVSAQRGSRGSRGASKQVVETTEQLKAQASGYSYGYSFGSGGLTNGVKPETLTEADFNRLYKNVMSKNYDIGYFRSGVNEGFADAKAGKEFNKNYKN